MSSRSTCLTRDHGLRLDFDQIVADQPADLEHRIPGGPTEASAVRARDRLPMVCVLEIDAGAHDVVEAGAQRRQARGDLVEDEGRLSGGIAGQTTSSAPLVAVVPLTSTRSPTRTARL